MFAEVLDVERITPGLIRVRFGGGDLHEFESTEYTDQYINGYFVPPDATYPVPFNLDEVRTLGFAGPWAKRAEPGDKLQFKGPNGSYSPNPEVDWHFFAGDETAIPGISASVESLGTGSHCVVFIVVDSHEFEIPIHTDATLDLNWLHRNDATDPSSLLLTAVRNFDFLDGTYDVFDHGEAGEVRGLRKYLVNEKSLNPDTASISPYWRRNHTDEAWRKVKKEWLAEQENDT